MVIKNGTKIGSATVVSKNLLKPGAMIPNKKMTPTSVTIHNTDCWDVPANNFYRSLKRQNETKPDSGEASFHFAVDDKEIYQMIDTTNCTWHAGDKTGNATSIGIEICMFKDKARHEKAKKNAIALVVHLLKAHKLNTGNVKKHQDWSGKYCPSTILKEKNGWSNFTKAVKDLYNGSISSPAPTKWKNGSYSGKKGRITTDVLRVRKARGTNHPIIGRLTKGTIVNLEYCLDGWVSIPFVGGVGGMGYISTDYVELL